MQKKTLILLFLVVLVGGLLRFGGLNFNPPSLNWDEVSHGYNADSILKTGKDEWGKLPLFNFRAYGDYPTTLNLYLTIPFIRFLGLNELGVRFPHALLGTLTIISTYFLVWGLTRKKNLSLLTAFLVSVTPWYVFTSRFVLQANLSVFLLITSLAFFFHREKKRIFLPLSLLFLFLTLFSYHSTRIFFPLFLLAILSIYKKEVMTKAVIFLTLLFYFVTATIFLQPESRARSKFLFLIDETAVARIIAKRQTSKLPESFKRILYNRPLYFVSEFSKNYLSYFFPRFLFFEGGTQYQFSVPGRGLIYLINLPFFYLGIVLLIGKAREKKDFRLLLAWLLLAPIPASLTNEKSTVVRAMTILPLPEILISLGAVFLYEKLGEKVLLNFLYLLLILLSLGNYLTAYLTDYRTDYSWSWQYGYKEVVDYARQNYEKYDKIIVTKKYGEPHEFFLFFWPWEPIKYRTDPSLVRFNQSDWWWVDRFDKFFFVNDWQVKEMRLESGGEIDCQNVRCLLVSTPGNSPAGWHTLKVINFLDGRSAFEIYANK